MAQTGSENRGDVAPLQFGNYRIPQSKGLAGLSTAATVLLIVGAVFCVFLVMLHQWIAAAAVVLLIAVADGLTVVKDKHGMTLVGRIVRRAGWWNTRYTGANVYRSGPAGRVPGGTNQLPGISARSQVTEHMDAYGRPFALIEVPQKGHFTVVFGSEPDGGGMVDQEQMNRWVSRWGQWLSMLTDEPGLAAAAVTIETAPDTGYRLARKVNAHIVDDAPDFARQVMDEAVQMLPSGATTTRAYVAVTFRSVLRAGGRPRKAGEMGQDLASRLPAITSSLSGTGAGVAVPLTAQQLFETIRVAYDPAGAALFDQAHAEGRAPKLEWHDCGPQAHEARWDSYRHDNAVSKSWTMSLPPRSAIQATVLQGLLEPAPEIARKRVTMLYRPIDPARAASLVENDVNTALFNASTRNRETARDTRDLQAARAAAAEEASGAGLLNFGMIVTATVLNERQLADAEAVVENLAASARIRLREAFGSQDSTFAAGLPLGVVIPDHMALPTRVREAL
jgi:hypothetical protein